MDPNNTNPTTPTPDPVQAPTQPVAAPSDIPSAPASPLGTAAPLQNTPIEPVPDLQAPGLNEVAPQPASDINATPVGSWDTLASPAASVPLPSSADFVNANPSPSDIPAVTPPAPVNDSFSAPPQDSVQPSQPTWPSDPTAAAPFSAPISQPLPEPAVDQGLPVPTFTPSLSAPSDSLTPPTEPIGSTSSPSPVSLPDAGIPSFSMGVNPSADQAAPSSTAPDESVPTDLSQLVGNPSMSPPPPISTPPSLAVAVAQPESLVVPSADGSSQVVTESGKGFPKWIFAVGALVLIIAVGASAYFILGVGQTEQSSSLPAEPTNEQFLTTPPEIVTPVVTEGPAAVPSLPVEPQVSVSPTQSGSSVFDRLKNQPTPQL